jgi:hypothetical protein
MPTQYLVTNSLAQAKAQSKTWWERVLGHPKKAEDVSEFLVDCKENPVDMPRAVLIVTQEAYDEVYPKLTPQEKQFADANLLPETDPYAVAFLNATRWPQSAGPPW